MGLSEGSSHWQRRSTRWITGTRPSNSRSSRTSASPAVDYRVGDRVRLWPLGDADILDIAMKGKTATIVAIEQDFEDRVYLAVTVEDDPGQDMGVAGKPGHRFFFGPRKSNRSTTTSRGTSNYASAHLDRRHRQHLPG